MALRFALLALLTAQPMTGYDVTKAFRSSVGHVWHAPDSQIYPELRRMESEGLLAARAIPWGPRSTKTEYTVTADGEAALRAWMTTPVDYPVDRDPAHLRVAYLEFADDATARRVLEEHAAHYRTQRAQHAQQLASIRDRSHPILSARLARADLADHDRIVAVKALAYEGMIARDDAEIAWATRALDVLGV